METVHTDLSQINDFNQVAQAHNFELIAVNDDMRSRDLDGELSEPPPEPSQEVPVGEVLNMIFKQTFNIVTPNWNVTDDEVSMMVAAYEPVIEKYDLASKISLGVEVSAIVTTLIIFAPRLNTPRKVVKAPTQEQPAENQVLGGLK